MRCGSQHKDHVWSYDCLTDHTEDGRPLGHMAVIDETRVVKNRTKLKLFGNPIALPPLELESRVQSEATAGNIDAVKINPTNVAGKNWRHVISERNQTGHCDAV